MTLLQKQFDQVRKVVQPWGYGVEKIIGVY
ncbi:hypothetical protein IGI67_000299 [Enterococcus sp. AZ196]